MDLDKTTRKLSFASGFILSVISSFNFPQSVASDSDGDFERIEIVGKRPGASVSFYTFEKESLLQVQESIAKALEMGRKAASCMPMVRSLHMVFGIVTFTVATSWLG